MSLTIITGPMFSGKTTHLIDMVFDLQKTNMIVIKHHIDTRYDSDCIVTHDNKMIEATKMHRLLDVFTFNSYYECEYILIDEGQFFEDLYDFVRVAVDIDGKHVYISGLMSDYQRKPFKVISQVLPLADNIIFKHGKCAHCDAKSIFSKRKKVVDEKQDSEGRVPTGQVLIGSTNYEPVCRKCYNL
jgi:thymidine kinase